jgi:suppressor of ftsI
LSVSPERPQDDVIDMTAMPGQELDYIVRIPRDHPPGLHWYHTHPHGESLQQVLDGMSGALIIDGVERYVPAIRSLRDRILVIRAVDLEHDQRAASKRARVDVQRTPCGESHDEVSRVFTVNGVLRPEIEMRPGEPQFWRIVNAAPDRYVDVDLPGQRFNVVAYDGLPIAYHDPANPTHLVDHVLLPPAGRVEAIVPAPSGGRVAFRTRCVDTGRDGDPNPGMVLADVVLTDRASTTIEDSARVASEPPAPRIVDVERAMQQPPAFTATFTEGEHRFYINDHLYSPADAPMVRAKVGQFQHWRIVNNTQEIHPMHIHQAHFFAFLENGRPVRDPHWLDTVNVPVGGSVDVVMDFTDPVIRGMSVFHCHLLNHEDKGMMAKIFFE